MKPVRHALGFYEINCLNNLLILLQPVKNFYKDNYIKNMNESIWNHVIETVYEPRSVQYENLKCQN